MKVIVSSCTYEYVLQKTRLHAEVIVREEAITKNVHVRLTVTLDVCLEAEDAVSIVRIVVSRVEFLEIIRIIPLES